MMGHVHSLAVLAATVVLAAVSCSADKGHADVTDVLAPPGDGDGELVDGRADALPEDGGAPDAAVTPLENLLVHVDPMIGTGGLSYRLGSVFVGASLPFGTAKVGPDTKHESWGEPDFTHCEGYWYPDTHVAGFSHMHIHGTGAPDYGSLLVQPGYGMNGSKVTEKGYMLPLDHANEVNEPGYYGLLLGKPGILAELTATTRVGVHRYTFPKTDDAVIIVDPSHVIASCEVDQTHIEIDPAAGTFEGMLHTGCALSGRFGGYPLYFSGAFRRTPTDAGVWQDDLLLDGDVQASGPQTGAWFRFEADLSSPVELVVGLSFVDLDNARKHALEEVGDKGFDEVRSEAQDAWNEALGRARAHFPEDVPDAVRIQYYTSLYHSMLMPTVWSEGDGRYLAFDDTVHSGGAFTYYTDFSMWDTYRNLHPLLFLLFPEESSDMLRSLVDMAGYSGCLPQWVLANGDSGSMIGRPASIIVADGWLHGIQPGDEEVAYERLLQSHAVPVGDEPVLECSAGDGLHHYIQYGYHPSDIEGGSVSKTQEIAWADFCVAQVAEARGDSQVADALLQRSLNPYNLYSAEDGFFIGKDSLGNWVEEFDRFLWEDFYVEGNAWQYLWLVPHDPAGLAAVMGGVDSFFARLDEFFEKTAAWSDPVVPPKHYFHGNEPDIHAPFLYSALGRPASAAEWSRWVMDNEYYVDPEGLAGNDDAGTLAAWYVFATLGFYPIPCTGRYLIGSPRIAEAWLNSLGAPLHIVVENASEARPYVASVTWNGASVDTPWLSVEQFQQGGELRFVMSEVPGDFGTGFSFAPVADRLDGR